MARCAELLSERSIVTSPQGKALARNGLEMVPLHGSTFLHFALVACVHTPWGLIM